MFFLKELPSRQILEGYRERFPEMDLGSLEEALALLRRASLLIRELDAYFAQHDLSQLRFLILVVIDREPDRDSLTASEIIDRLDVSKPVMARTLRSLSSAGFIVIERDDEDHRAKRVMLTSSGQEKINTVLPGYYRLISSFMTATKENYSE